MGVCPEMTNHCNNQNLGSCRTWGSLEAGRDKVGQGVLPALREIGCVGPEKTRRGVVHSPSCLCNACIVGVNAHGFFKSGGSGNLWCIFSIFPVTLFFLLPSVSLPTMHRFTCKLLSVVCGECTKFKHINKHFNFQMVSSLYSWAGPSLSLPPPCPCQTCGNLSPVFWWLWRAGTC